MNNRKKTSYLIIGCIVFGLLASGDILAQANQIFSANDMVPVSRLTASGDYNWPGSEIEIIQYNSPQLLNVQIGYDLNIADPKILYQSQFTDPGTVNGFLGIGPVTSGNWNWRDPGLRPDSLRNPGETTWRPQMNIKKRN